MFALTKVQSSGDVILPVSEGTALNWNLVSPCKVNNSSHFSVWVSYTSVSSANKLVLMNQLDLVKHEDSGSAITVDYRRTAHIK